MVYKIKEMPMLSSKDAERLDCAIKNNKTKKVDQSEYERAKSIYERVSKSLSSRIS